MYGFVWGDRDARVSAHVQERVERPRALFPGRSYEQEIVYDFEDVVYVEVSFQYVDERVGKTFENMAGGGAAHR